MTMKLAVIGGDGTGPKWSPKVSRSSRRSPLSRDFTFETTPSTWAVKRFLKTGEILPPDTIERLRNFDSIYLAAVGHPRRQPGVLEKGLHSSNSASNSTSTSTSAPSSSSRRRHPAQDKKPQDIDFVVVRENTEDLYCGVGGFLKKNTPGRSCHADGRVHPQGLRAVHPLGV